jgi:uncharacterized damage-inducible protein DinB
MTRRRLGRGLVAWRRRAVERMTRSRAATLRVVRAIPEPELRRPRTQGAWAVTDVLAHIAAWEEEGVRRLRLLARGADRRLVWYETMAEVDRYNARAVRAARRASVAALLRRLARARAGLVAALRRLPASRLGDPSPGRPVTRWLREFAWTHETAHRAEIRAWWRGRSARARA